MLLRAEFKSRESVLCVIHERPHHGARDTDLNHREQNLHAGFFRIEQFRELLEGVKTVEFNTETFR